MTNPFLALAQPGLAQLKPYQPGKPLAELERELGVRDAIKLASNENPLGPSPKALDAIRSAMASLALYPEGAAPTLRERLATLWDLSPERFIFGNGSDQVIEMLCRAFSGPGQEVIVSQYAFAAYAIAARACGATVREIAAKEYGHDLKAMGAALSPQTRLVFIANPNNPTGTVLSAAELEAFIAEVPSQVIVVVDEAYAELMDRPDYPHAMTWLPRFPNLVVTRTFSKAYGLAGLRCGYGVGHPDLIGILERLRQPFNINQLAQVGASAALDDEDHLQRSLANNRAGLAQLLDGLGNLGLTTLPATGNFVTFSAPGGGQRIYEALLRRGVIIRPLMPYGMADHLRVSVGTPEENHRFLQSLGEVL